MASLYQTEFLFTLSFHSSWCTSVHGVCYVNLSAKHRTRLYSSKIYSTLSVLRPAACRFVMQIFLKSIGLAGKASRFTAVCRHRSRACPALAALKHREAKKGAGDYVPSQGFGDEIPKGLTGKNAGITIKWMRTKRKEAF